jgi:heme A synthase
VENNKTLACFGLLAFLIVQVVLGSIVDGYVLVKLWAWFAVSTFGVQPLSLVPAIGFGLLVGYLTHQYVPQKKDRDISTVISEAVSETFIYPFIILFLGWIVSFYM